MSKHTARAAAERGRGGTTTVVRGDEGLAAQINGRRFMGQSDLHSLSTTATAGGTKNALRPQNRPFVKENYRHDETVGFGKLHCRLQFN